MNDTELQNTYPRRDASFPRMYSPNLQPLLQSLLSTLADMDFEYEMERERISKSSPESNVKIRHLEKLRAQHHERREPYIRQLALLQQRMFSQ
jgi:hypothetical protein